jgi:hypothetical protein
LQVLIYRNFALRLVANNIEQSQPKDPNVDTATAAEMHAADVSNIVEVCRAAMPALQPGAAGTSQALSQQLLENMDAQQLPRPVEGQVFAIYDEEKRLVSFASYNDAPPDGACLYK